MAKESDRARDTASTAQPGDALQTARGAIAPLRAGEFAPGAGRRWLLRLGDWRLDLAGGLASAIERERETSALFNLTAVIFACGIVAYFAAPAEPLLAVLMASTVALGFFAWRARVHGAWYLMALCGAVFLAGMCLAQIRTVMTDTPVIGQEMTATVSGLVLRTDTNTRGSPRYLIRPTAISGMSDEALPARIRLSSSSRQQRFAAGDTVEGRARIMPISGPAFPGGYDFAFFSRYDRLGGTGFFYGAPHRSAQKARPTATDSISIALSRFRAAMAYRIRDGLPGEAGDVAVALITGDRSGIDAATSESLRGSGLAHVLAISGLHMALVTLTVVAVLRWLLAWSPEIVLNFPVRKWAAAAGLASATAYLVISGASVATQRAWIMIAIMLAALLADRRAVTIRNVALAALIILALAPESLLQPGFQMSFAAAAALVAAYEAWNRRRRVQSELAPAPNWPLRLITRIPVYFGALLFTSLVAGLATGLFAAWHFHRIAPLGLLSNALAMPLVTLVVMPMALLSALAMPYGFEKLPLALMGWGIDWMIAISDWINGFTLPGVVGRQSLLFLCLAGAGLATLTLLRSRLRLLGLVPLLALPLAMGAGRMPDLLVSQDGRAIAVADGHGHLTLLYPRRNRFVSDIWLRAWSGGDEGMRSVVSDDCNPDFCAATLSNVQRLEVVYDPDLLKRSCETADILVAPRLRWVNCRERKPALILKRGDFETGGSHAVWLKPPEGTDDQTQPAIRIRTAISSGTRPWNHQPPARELSTAPES